MTMNIDRRQLMALGTFGLGALGVPASAALIGAKGRTRYCSGPAMSAMAM